MKFRIEEVALKRLEKKLWQYEDYEPARVELAVLDAYRETGWSGYFSEHQNFDDFILFLMCWPDDKRITRAKWLDMPNVDYLFYKADDGFLASDRKAGFTTDELLDNALNFQPCSIVGKIENWRACSSARSILNYLNQTDNNGCDLAEYFYASGGKHLFLNRLREKFPAERLRIMAEARNLCDNAKKHNNRTGDTSIFDLCLGFFTLLNITSYSKPDKTYLESLCVQAKNSKAQLLATSYINLLDRIEALNFEYPQLKYREYALLDLRLWKSNEVASVEVKAPGDRLRPHQRKQLEADATENRSSWVINVIEK